MNFLKRITTVLFFTSMAVLPSAQSALNDFDRQEFPFKNGLAEKNPGLESGIAGWTCTPAMTVNSGTQINPRSKLYGQWDSASAGQNCYSTAVKIPQSGNCAVGIWYAIPSGTGTHLLVANDGSNDLATETITSSTLAQYQEVEFPCSASSTGNARIGIRSVASNEPSISFDDGYIGRATQVRDVSIVTDWVPYSPAIGNLGTGSTVTNSGYWRIVGDSMQIVMRVIKDASGGSGSSAVSFALPNGYTIDSTKLPATSLQSLGYATDLQSGTVGSVLYLSSTTVYLYAMTAGAGQWNGSAFLANKTVTLNFTVPLVGRFARSALDAEETVDFTGAVFYVGTSTCPAGSLDADGAAVSRTTYSRLFNRIGTTFGVGDGSTTFNKPDLRGIFVRGVGSQTFGSETYTGTLGTKQNDQLEAHTHTYDRFAIFTGTAAINDGGNPGGNTSTASGSAGSGTETRPANIGMRPCIAWGRAPSAVLTNSVSTANVNGDKIGTARLDCDAASTVVENPQSMVSSIGNISGGTCVATLATGYFSAKPICTVSWDGNGTRETFYSVCTTATSCNVGSHGGATTAQMNMICTGPR